MKIRPFILLLCLAAILVAILAVFWQRKRSTLPTAGATSSNSVVAKTVSLSQPIENKISPIDSSVPSESNPVSSFNGNPLRQMSEREEVQETLDTQNDMPIVFYGRLEDQFGNPVTAAEIKGIIYINNSRTNGYADFTTMSDANGLFELDGGQGANLTLLPKKAGYTLATTGTYFNYSHMANQKYFVPDRNNPVVIKMWKLQGAEPLVSIHQDYRLRYTATPIYFDLVAGRIVSSGGDLKITANRPAGIISGANPQDWSIDLEVVGGGFIESSPDEAGMTFFAPESGYQASGKFGKNNGPDLIDKTLFIQSRNGEVYSKVHLLFGINAQPDGFMNVTFDGVANTNGSRNWEATAPQ